MSKKASRTEELSHELLHSYIEMRRKIDIEADFIYSITSMLTNLETCSEDNMSIDPSALGKINQIINRNILNIMEVLDDFIYIVQAKIELEKLSENK